MSLAGQLLSLHFAAAPLNRALLKDRAVLTALQAIGQEIAIRMACEAVDRQAEAWGWR